MQADLQLSKKNNSIFYYKSKLNTMNLTLTDIENDETKCYVWHEGEGGKGTIEIETCILRYVSKTPRQICTLI